MCRLTPGSHDPNPGPCSAAMGSGPGYFDPRPVGAPLGNQQGASTERGTRFGEQHIFFQIFFFFSPCAETWDSSHAAFLLLRHPCGEPLAPTPAPSGGGGRRG